MSTDIRQGVYLPHHRGLCPAAEHLLEFVLLSDSLGVSTLVDAINNAKPPGATESTVLGPFYTEDAHDGMSSCLFSLGPTETKIKMSLVEFGGSIASEGKGDYMYVEGRVTDTQGNGIANAVIDTWETDGHGLYDTQVGN